MYQDFREYLSTLEARGLLSRVTRPVDKDWEIAAVCRVNFRDIPARERTALCFEQVQGFSVPLVAGVLGGSDAIYAAALSTTVDRVLDTWTAGARSPIPPVLVADGPIHENVLTGEAADVCCFPHPVWTVGQDPGPYITSACVVSKDPETGVRNVGTYRFQIKGQNRLGMMASARQGVARHIAKNDAEDRPTEIAIVLGPDPVVGLTSVSSFPHGQDELAIAGGIRGEALPVVRGCTVDLDVPATAEIVIEGRVLARVREEEGPFGEYTGYMGASGDHYVVEVSAVCFRNNPVYQAFVSQMPPSESSCIRRLGRSMTIYRHLTQVLGLPVTDVLVSEASGSGPFIYIALKKGVEGQPVQAMYGAWSVDPSLGKFVVVVDDDIDIHDPAAVEWALGWRVQPERDVHLQRGTVPLGLDPSQHGPLSSKVGIDATRKGAYPANSVPPAEHLTRVRQAWSSYGVRSCPPQG
jgi:UbiD family decarboxylase